MKIPLPDLLRKMREQQFERDLRPGMERWALRLWSYAARHPWLYRPGARLASRFLRLLGGERGRVLHLAGAAGWTSYRDLPTPSQATFKQQFAQRAKDRNPV